MKTKTKPSLTKIKNKDKKSMEKRHLQNDKNKHFIITQNNCITFQTVYRQCIQDHNNSQQMIVGPGGVGNITIECQKPWGMVSDDVFPNLWRIIYWSSQFLTWLIMPLMQSYLKAGDFTIKGKLKAAVIDNAIYYGSYLFICGILLIYLALKPDVHLDWQKLKAIASSASNTWGLFLLVLLLGKNTFLLKILDNLLFRC